MALRVFRDFVRPSDLDFAPIWQKFYGMILEPMIDLFWIILWRYLCCNCRPYLADKITSIRYQKDISSPAICRRTKRKIIEKNWKKEQTMANLSIKNNCIGDDTKAAASQSPNCILKKKQKIWQKKTIFNMADGILIHCNVARLWHWFRQVTAPCNVACGSGIMTVNSPSGSTLQRDTWLWDDMPLNSPKRPPYCNFTWFRFRPYHRSRHVILHKSVKFYPNRTTLGRKNDVMSIFKMADLRRVRF